MSFSFYSNDKTPAETAAAIDNDQQMPPVIAEYVMKGIQALHRHYGDEVKINVSAHGHLHNGEEGNWDSTTATITVSRAVEQEATTNG